MANILRSIHQFLIILCSLVCEFFKGFLPLKRKNISGKVVLITGAGGGIGRQLALKFAEQKTKLALLDIDKASCDETAREVSALNAPCYSYVCDVSRKENVERVGEMVRRDLGEVDILVNNAGVISLKNFLDLKEEDVRRIINVNLLSPIWTTQEFLPEMYRRDEGHIVNISSLIGCMGFANVVDYSLTKFGIRGMSESLAEDFIARKKFGIHISIVYPTAVDTQLFRKVTFTKNFTPLSVETAVDIMMEGILANKKHIFVPNNLWKASAMNNLFPEETMKIVRSFDEGQICFDEK